MRRVIVSAVAVLALALGAGNALADDGDDGEGDGTVVVTPIDTPWVLASSQDPGGACSRLPSGATVTMLTGTQRSITKVRTNSAGITTIRNFTHSFGTSVDEAGRVYPWDYKNRFRVSNTLATPGVFSGLMFDRFSVGGREDDEGADDDDRGDPLLRNGFRAVFTTDFTTFAAFDPISSFGDPIDFATGAAHCDPL